MITGGQSVVVMLLLPCDDGDEQGCESGVQKFRVKMLAESGGQSTVDVLCQIGLDGIRMLDPNTSRTLRIYPIENITRCDKFDSSTFAFWSKSSVDVVEPRRIRLQSNSYTTNTLLDTVTAHHTEKALAVSFENLRLTKYNLFKQENQQAAELKCTRGPSSP
ncbi:hypothetical protein AAZX31_14G204900 [Glycine max]|uniref:Uncharacterized protein n=1 Tax=Glycine max TaxID=3847 RepID=K7M8J9_SOYBN|nr:protein FREE1 isoform X1 [Glycine max]XP_028199847.1 protein FREE1-like isoform X1 [Glycine soja]KAG4383067.1 hypothetical protein GLYMA_14G220500v4 [Glycine max]KAG4383068.1 hypothetical protein GLYMA_14G220500v4 [Glycine max]KAH1095741.1 hypothetical protein GYH30_040827 [Glycine max]KAH1095744.1 hypothetical protein GYH30_040827 [Glycine max]KRH17455.1 hypothetical protein GLYMA_14G220500v4 [Glycine max]|eukprot:XP_006596539.1 protein FREE1 isoform X1 [Glycine max]